MRPNNLFFILILTVEFLFAQDINNTKVKVIEGFNPSIPEANRLNENAILIDTIKENRMQEYNIIDVDIKSDFKINPLRPATVKASKISQLFNTRMSLGTGFGVTSRSSLLYNSKRSKRSSYSILLNQYSNNIKIDAKEAGSSIYDINISGKIIKDKNIYTGHLEYENKGFFTYGKGTDDNSKMNNPFYNRFSFSEILFSVLSKERDERKLRHHTVFFASDLNQGVENEFFVNSNLEKNVYGLDFSLGVELNRYLNYNSIDTAYKGSGVSLIRFAPSLDINTYGFDFQLGLEVKLEQDTNVSFSFAPHFQISKEIVEDILLIQTGLRHIEYRNTLRSIFNENPYIHSYGMNQSVLGYADDRVKQEVRMVEDDEFYFSIYNILGKGQFFNVDFSYGFLTDFPYFVAVQTDDYIRFKINYMDLQQLTIKSNYNLTFSKILSLDASFKFYHWNEEVYHHPNIESHLSLPINLREKIYITPSFAYIGQRLSRKEFHYSPADSPLPEVMSLSSIFHANLELHYNYSKQLSFYFELNNLTNSKNELWIDYKNFGLNGVFGVSYSF